MIHIFLFSTEDIEVFQFINSLEKKNSIYVEYNKSAQRNKMNKFKTNFAFVHYFSFFNKTIRMQHNV